jgi:DNA-binding beta-propeller fold protein YncE
MWKRLLLGFILLVVLATGYLWLHRSDTAGELRTVPVPGGYVAMVVDERAGRLVVSSGGAAPHGIVSILDTRTGAVLARRAVSLREAGIDCCLLRLAIDGQSGHVFVGSAGDNRLLMLDVRSGALLQTVALPGLFMAAAVDERAGRVLVLDRSGVSMLDSRGGRVLRRFPLRTRIDPLLPMGLGVDDAAGHAIFTGFGDTRAFVVDTRRGRLQGVGAAGSNPQSIVVDRRTGRVFALDYGISGAGSTVRVLDARTGALLSRTAVGETPIAGAVDERTGRVFVLNAAHFSAAGSVSVLEARTGRLLRTVPLHAIPVAAAVDTRTDQVFIAARAAPDRAGLPVGAGSLVVLDARSGLVLRRAALGVNPLAVAVDARAGRAFVLDAGGVEHVADRWSWVPGWLRARLPIAPEAGYRTTSSSVTMFNAAG